MRDEAFVEIDATMPCRQLRFRRYAPPLRATAFAITAFDIY